jgi:hypothetical protein
MRLCSCRYQLYLTPQLPRFLHHSPFFSAQFDTSSKAGNRYFTSRLLPHLCNLTPLGRLKTMADAAIIEAVKKHPAPEGLIYTYGTAGVSCPK